MDSHKMPRNRIAAALSANETDRPELRAVKRIMAQVSERTLDYPLLDMGSPKLFQRDPNQPEALDSPSMATGFLNSLLANGKLDRVVLQSFPGQSAPVPVLYFRLPMPAGRTGERILALAVAGSQVDKVPGTLHVIGLLPGGESCDCGDCGGSFVHLMTLGGE